MSFLHFQVVVSVSVACSTELILKYDYDHAGVCIYISIFYSTDTAKLVICWKQARLLPLLLYVVFNQTY